MVIRLTLNALAFWRGTIRGAGLAHDGAELDLDDGDRWDGPIFRFNGSRSPAKPD